MPNLNPEAAFESMKTQVEAAIKGQFPFEGKKRRLELISLAFDERASEPTAAHHVDNVHAQYNAKTKGRTWGVPLRGQLRLVDLETRKTVEETTLTLALLPKLTRRYSYVIEGQERQHDSVFRSMPRPYHRIANNGEIQAEWNLARGLGFKLIYYPVKGHIRMKLGETHVPVGSVLKVMGVGDATMERYFGRVVYEACKKDMKPVDLDKMFKSLRLRKQEDRGTIAPDEKKRRILAYFSEQTEVWPDAMESAFGKPFSTVTSEGLLLSSKRLLAIQHGRNKENPTIQEKPDDRQALSSKYLTSTEDFIVEAIAKKTAELKRRVLQRIDRDDRGIANIFNNHDFNKVINGVFEHAQRPDQTNPLQMLSGHVRTTIRGSEYGGVGGSQTNVNKDKQINPTHLGFLDTIQTPESSDTGIALHLPLGVQSERAPDRKGRASSGHLIKTRVYDVKAKEWVMATPGLLERANVAFPDQVKWSGKIPVPIAQEVICYDSERQQSRMPWNKVQYILPSSKALFSFSANLIPFLQNNNGNRAMTAAKQQEQAVSLKDREAPLVQTQTDEGKTFEETVGSFSAHYAPSAGTVVKVQKDMIHIRGANRKVTKVPIYKDFPLNGAKTFVTAHPVVKAGDVVKKGQLIADTNYTRNGKLAMGKNLRVAYMPYKGLNFEDGVVISETAAKKLTSDHMHQESVTIYPGMLGGTEAGDLGQWVRYAIPERTTMEKMSKLDKSGVIKEGTPVESGDVMVAVLSPSQDAKEDELHSRLHKSLVKPYRDKSLIWDHSYPGKVIKVIQHNNTVTVHVRTEEPMVVGDKLCGRHGNKGIVSRIVPDHKMPHDAQDTPVHILLNPAGVPTRMNVGQVLETAASKIAKKTGKPYIIENFTPGVDYSAKVKMDLAKHGLSDTEVLYDPETRRPLGKILTGDQYILKLHHTVDKKQTARSYGTYTGAGDAPSGSGIPGGGQKMDLLTTYSMLSHGAKHNLREAQSFKSDGEQERVWDAVMLGHPLPAPESAAGMRNFMAYLRVLGVNAEKKGDQYVLMPLTDKQTKKVSNGLIENPEKALYAKGALTIDEAKGLFEPRITGGRDGPYWSHIDLAERMPGPLYEKAIQSVLNIKKSEYAELTSDKLVDGKSGFKTIVERLEAIDVDKDLAKAKASLSSLRGSPLNKAYRRVRYLEALKKNGISPVDAYTNKTLPVIPPKMRKVSIGLDGKQILDDMNGLYLQVGYANGALARSHASNPEDEKQKERAHLYTAIKALRITGMSIGKGKAARHHAGMMERLTGKIQGEGAPKHSFPQKGVLGRRQDLSGRSTIVPEPDMGLDEVGIPIPIALEMYKPFVVRELRRQGVTPARGLKMVMEKDEKALRALEEVVKDHPVLLKRDPALHKFSAMAFRPRLIHGKAIAIHPLACGGFNADFDGDAMALFVPVGDEAIDEARGMVPSKNLFSPTHFGLMSTPGQGSLLGLYQASKWGAAAAVPNKVTRKQVIKLMEDGKLKPDNVVAVDGKLTTPGRLALAETLPPELRNHEKLLYDKQFRLDKGGMKEVMTEAARKDEKHFPKTVNDWKDVGNRLAYLSGSSISINDFHDGHKFRDHILAPYKREEAAVLRSKASKKVKDKKVIEIYGRAQEELETVGKKRYAAIGENKMFEWTSSGARGNWGQFSQLVFGPMLVLDAEKKTVAVPLTKSYGEGLSLSEYWASMHGARKGILDRVAGTQEPGALTKDIINTVIDYKISNKDCGDTSGTQMSPRDLDVVGRFLAGQVTLKAGATFKAGTALDTRILTRIRNAGIMQIPVRSPLHCKMQTGICAMCYGQNQNGKLHRAGVNIGTIAGQSLGEPVTQLTMKTFHSGGVAGGKKDVVGAFDRVKQLFFVPDKLTNAATLATVGGRIESASKDARGGHSVFIKGKEHRVITGDLLPSIRVGAMVSKGDALSTGPINPHHLLQQTNSMPQVRNYLTGELDLAYNGDKPSGSVRRRNIETVVRAMTNRTMITDAPPESGFLRGQRAYLSRVEGYNAQALTEGRQGIKHAPQLKSMTQIPVTGTEDWMGRLNYRGLKNTFEEGAAQGWASDIHGDHPIPGLMHGAEFGIRPYKPKKSYSRKKK